MIPHNAVPKMFSCLLKKSSCLFTQADALKVIGAVSDSHSKSSASRSSGRHSMPLLRCTKSLIVLLVAGALSWRVMRSGRSKGHKGKLRAIVGEAAAHLLH